LPLPASIGLETFVAIVLLMTQKGKSAARE